VRTCYDIGPKVANRPVKFDGILFSAKNFPRPKISAFISNSGQAEKYFSLSALTPIVKALGLISLNFAPIGMLDLG
jgi:hypothetical protein